jgi:hypothetical protein
VLQDISTISSDLEDHSFNNNSEKKEVQGFASNLKENVHSAYAPNMLNDKTCNISDKLETICYCTKTKNTTHTTEILFK